MGKEECTISAHVSKRQKPVRLAPKLYDTPADGPVAFSSGSNTVFAEGCGVLNAWTTTQQDLLVEWCAPSAPSPKTWCPISRRNKLPHASASNYVSASLVRGGSQPGAMALNRDLEATTCVAFKWPSNTEGFPRGIYSSRPKGIEDLSDHLQELFS